MITPTEIVLAARKTAAATGIPASVSIAQWALESNRGKQMPVGSFNPFGLKIRSGKNDPFVEVTTKEWSRIRGYYNVVARFRKFASISEAFDAHAQLLLQPVYAKARKALPDAEAFANALTGVYATDPLYGSKLTSIMKSDNLLQYDKP